MVEGADLLLKESNVLLDQSTVLQSHHPIHAGCCGETYHQVTDGGKFVVTFYHHNTKATEEIHPVRCLQSHQNGILQPVSKMINPGEAYFGAESGEESMFVDKDSINHQFNILLEFDQLLRDFYNTLCQALAILMNCIPFHLEDRLTSTMLLYLRV